MTQMWLTASRQGWKLTVFYSLIAMLVVAVSALIGAANDPDSDTVAESLAVVVSGIAAVGWLFVAVRCPHCRRSVMLRVVQSARAANWLESLKRLERCPHCLHSLRSP